MEVHNTVSCCLIAERSVSLSDQKLLCQTAEEVDELGNTISTGAPIPEQVYEGPSCEFKLCALSVIPVVLIPTNTVPIDYVMMLCSPYHPKYKEVKITEQERRGWNYKPDESEDELQVGRNYVDVARHTAVTRAMLEARHPPPPPRVTTHHGGIYHTFLWAQFELTA